MDERGNEAGAGPPRTEPGMAGSTVALLASSGTAAGALVLAAATGGLYLGSSLNGWIALFGFAAFAAMFSVPFAANRVLASRSPKDERWEAAMLVWGAVALGALLIGGLLIAAGGFSPAHSLADAAGLLLVIEAGMVLLCLLGWLLSG
jgi:hypothetical protein